MFSPVHRAASVAAIGLFGSLLANDAHGQVAVHPSTVAPAAWERFAIRVVGREDGAIIGIRVDVPEAIAVLGVEGTPARWSAQLIEATDSTPQAIAWSGGLLAYRQFREFAFLGRVMGHSKRNQLVFPIRLTLEDGREVPWRGGRGDPRPAPRVQIVGTARVSAGGALAAAGVAFAIALIALAVAGGKKKGPNG